MKCEKCKIEVTGEHTRCPLCQGDLTGEAKPGVFPPVPYILKNQRLFISIMAFASVAALAICLVINLSLPEYGWWFWFVLAGIASFWLAFSVVLVKRGNLFKTIMWQVALVSALAVIWDLLTGFRGWSIDFVIPIMCMAAMAAMPTLARFQKMQITDYMVYLLIDSIFGLLSLVLILVGVLTYVLPSALCVGVSIISLSALFFFEGKALRAEIARRLHI